MIKPTDIWNIGKRLFKKDYWNLTNTIEFFAFTTKLVIIVPGLIFNVQVWWFFIFALISSLALVLTSTVKTLPTIIYFNIVWIVLATTAILKHFGIILQGV